MKRYYQAIMVMGNGISDYQSPIMKTLQKVREWVNKELDDNVKYEYLAHIEINSIVWGDKFPISKTTKYYYEW